MDRQAMSDGNGTSDAKLEQWLSQVFPVVVRALKLPRPMEKVADRALEAVSISTALRWLEMLGIGKPDEIRLLAQSTPNAAAKLSSPEGQQAIRSWEANHRVVPVLWTLEGAVKTIRTFWRARGHPRRAVVRALAAMSASQVVPDAVEFREDVAATIGGSESSAVCLIEDYAATAVADEVEKIEGIDRLISRSLSFGPWVRSLWVCLKLRVQGMKRSAETDLKSGHPLWRLGLILREVAGRAGKIPSTGKDSESAM